MISPDGAEVVTSDHRTWREGRYRHSEWLLLPQVEVIGVGATSMAALTTTTEEGEQTTEQIPRTILTIAVDQEQAERVIYASRNGDLAFALRTEQSKVKSNRGVTARDIMPEIFAGSAS